MPEGPRGMASRTKGGPLTCYTRQDIIMAACLCSSQASSQSTRNLLVIFCYSLRLSYSPWTRVLHGCNEDAKNLLSCQIPKLGKSKFNIEAAKLMPMGGSHFAKALFEILFRGGGDPDT